jgi:hypothetical protein
MTTLLIVTVWSLVAGWIGYWIGYASRADEVKRLERDRHRLYKWTEQLRRANTELDPDLELERIRNV